MEDYRSIEYRDQVSSCSRFVMPQYPTKSHPTNHSYRFACLAYIILPCQRQIPHSLMRPLRVVVFDVLRDQVVEMLRTKRDEVVERFLLQALDKPLNVGLQIRCPYAVFLYLIPASRRTLSNSFR